VVEYVTRGFAPAAPIQSGVLLALGGVVSLVASVAASLLDYARWEQSGELVATTPTWIVAWHGLSVGLILFGIAWVVIRVVGGRSRTG
jgi:hypothetical protein